MNDFWTGMIGVGVGASLTAAFNVIHESWRRKKLDERDASDRTRRDLLDLQAAARDMEHAAYVSLRSISKSLRESSDLSEIALDNSFFAAQSHAYALVDRIQDQRVGQAFMHFNQVLSQLTQAIDDKTPPKDPEGVGASAPLAHRALSEAINRAIREIRP